MKTDKIGITFSAFDLLHAGHIKMLEEAKTICDHLIVGLQIDPTIDRTFKNKPTQSVVERYIQLKACRSVDEIIPYNTEEDLMDILKSFVIDVGIIGDDYKDVNFTGKEYCEEKGIQIYYNKRDHRFSSSALKKAVFDKELERINRK
ncbi:adenylyltransferase/cytidyltransferase family protein [Epilithonimonas ginsengisoli]|uniref:Adenylyltransferase/cytidyltransferase family protein n=1 Tax=Epilithonimonas ginsengisoli TaxID=1245592 RepID=A0ABU4JGI7_9FLAO|nr:MULTISPECIES: adenylyltransferase/cytidyltransferase family protein [Chryseobacterium group]MBV6880171.1 adenylyltransferase/cytidyltransferase family protein [Epilithonimonas sp. FP105]MDW8548801.1 adenylyltransferase/cytidyltransferase family protein [Epilithonimonas ginsengisoli]OAH76180.1 glycerol-3-phosphate cytidylyltransferase [Chryseobacterium sp. FP211-J200]